MDKSCEDLSVHLYLASISRSCTLFYTVNRLNLEIMLGLLSVTAAWGLVFLVNFPDTSHFKIPCPLEAFNMLYS